MVAGASVGGVLWVVDFRCLRGGVSCVMVYPEGVRCDSPGRSPGYGVAQYEPALKGRVVVVGGFVTRGFTPGYRMSPLRGDRISPSPLAN